MSEHEIRERVRSFIIENFLYMRPDYVLDDDERLIQRAVMDSLGVMELVQHLEATFDIAVADADVTEDNLGSVSAVVRYVCSRVSARA